MEDNTSHKMRNKYQQVASQGRNVPPHSSFWQFWA